MIVILLPPLPSSMKMNQYRVCYLVSVLLVYVLATVLIDKDTSATMLHGLLALVFGGILASCLRRTLPLQLLPDLNKKAVLITGCDSGFGNALAERMDELGLVVYAGCLFSEGPGAKALKEKCSDRLHILQLDVTKDKDVENAVQHVSESLGERVLWAVVNNAGIASCGNIEWHSIEMVEKVMDVNFLGQVRITKAFLPFLRETKGRVVNVISIAGYISCPWIIPYCASKSAALSFTEGLREELRKFSISVHSIEPYFYATTILDVIKSSITWDQCPQNLKEVYGLNYYTETRKKISWITYQLGRPMKDLSNVVDSILDASLSVHPQARNPPGAIDVLSKAVIVYCRIPIQRIVGSVTGPIPNWNSILCSLNLQSKSKKKI